MLYLEGANKKKEIECLEWDVCEEEIKRYKSEGVQRWDYQHVYNLFNCTFFLIEKTNRCLF